MKIAKEGIILVPFKKKLGLKGTKGLSGESCPWMIWRFFMQKRLNDFTGKESIFVDANIFLFHAFDTNSVAVDFLKKVERQLIKAFSSSLVLEEFF